MDRVEQLIAKWRDWSCTDTCADELATLHKEVIQPMIDFVRDTQAETNCICRLNARMGFGVECTKCRCKALLAAFDVPSPTAKVKT